MNIRSPRIGPQPWEVVRTKLDQSLPFANMRDTPYYRDAVWEQFSKQEYERRYRALRAKMREQKLDALIVPGGPSHRSLRARAIPNGRSATACRRRSSNDSGRRARSTRRAFARASLPAARGNGAHIPVSRTAPRRRRGNRACRAYWRTVAIDRAWCGRPPTAAGRCGASECSLADLRIGEWGRKVGREDRIQLPD